MLVFCRCIVTLYRGKIHNSHCFIVMMPGHDRIKVQSWVGTGTLM